MTTFRSQTSQALDLLDTGLSMYRQHFVSFIVIAAAWCVPVAICGALLVIGSSWLASELQIWVFLLAGLALLPLTTYLLTGLARAADQALAGQAIRPLAALSLHPLRAISMSMFMVIYGLLLQSVAGIIVFACLCPLWVGGAAFLGLFGGFSGSDPLGTALAFAILAIFIGGGYLATLFSTGVSAFGLVYGLHPWSVVGLKFGEAIQQSLELIGYRFRFNLLVWILGSMLVSAGLLTVSVVVGMAIALPAFSVLGAESTVAQAIGVAGAMAGLMVVIPPVSIWMTLLYRRNLAAREGHALEAAIRKWSEA